VWCQDNNLSLNVSKTKELTVDYRKRQAEQAPIIIDRAVVERVEFPWYPYHQQTIIAQTYQDSREEGMTKPQILKRFYSCTIKSILTGCITTWYGNCSASDHKVLEGSAFGPVRHWGQASCHPGPI
jgi:hypothetical protein